MTQLSELHLLVFPFWLMFRFTQAVEGWGEARSTLLEPAGSKGKQGGGTYERASMGFVASQGTMSLFSKDILFLKGN